MARGLMRQGGAVPQLPNVDRCTTETLRKALTDRLYHEGCELVLIQWTGGRDWVVVTMRTVAEPQDAR